MLNKMGEKISNSNILQIFGIKSESRQSELWNIYESAIIVIRKLLWWVRCETTRGHITRHLWRVARNGGIRILQSYGHHLRPILIFHFFRSINSNFSSHPTKVASSWSLQLRKQKIDRAKKSEWVAGGVNKTVSLGSPATNLASAI